VAEVNLEGRDAVGFCGVGSGVLHSQSRRAHLGRRAGFSDRLLGQRHLGQPCADSSQRECLGFLELRCHAIRSRSSPRLGAVQLVWRWWRVEARDFLACKGGSVVFLGRLVALFFGPSSSHWLARRRCPTAGSLDGTPWVAPCGSGVRGAGLSGRRLRSAGRQASRYGTAIAVAAIVLIGIVMWGIRRYRRSTLTSRKSPLHLPHGTRPSQLRSTWVEDSLSLVLAHRIWRSVSG